VPVSDCRRKESTTARRSGFHPGGFVPDYFVASTFALIRSSGLGGNIQRHTPRSWRLTNQVYIRLLTGRDALRLVWETYP
jgi:hypothetical protein